MALNKKQASLLASLVHQGILDQPNIGVRKLPPLTAPVQNQKSDYASYLLTNAMGNKGVAKAMGRSIASTQNADQEEKSLLSKLFDTLMIPNKMMASVGDAIANGMDEDGFLNNLGDTFGGAGKAVLDAGQALTEDVFGAGLAKLPFVGDDVKKLYQRSPFQQEDRTFQNVLHDKFDVNNKFLRYGGGLGLDILTDPTTYIGTGLLRRAAKPADVLDAKAAVGHSGGSAKAFIKPKQTAPLLPEAPSVANAALRGNPALDQNILGQLPKIPQISLKGQTAPSNLERTAQYEKWLKSEISKLRQRNTVSPGHISFSREDGKRIARLERELEILKDSASESFYAGDDFFKNASLRELLDDTSLVDEFDAVNPLKSIRIDEPTTPLTRGLQRRQNTPTGLTPAQMRVALGQKLPNPARTIEQKLVRRQVDFERAMTAVGKVADSPSKINMRSVNNVIQRIQDGQLPKVLPKVEGATGDAFKASKDIADNFIDDLMGQKYNAKTMRWQGPGGKMVSRKLPPEMSAGQQIAMFNKILGVAGPKSLDNAVAMLRSAEDHLISLGVQPVRYEGVRVRLSDIIKMTEGKVPVVEVLNNFTRKSFKDMNPVVREAIQISAAYRTMAMSDIVENVSKYAEKARRDVTASYVGRPKLAAEDQIIEGSLEHATRMGVTNKELGAIKDLVKDIVNVDKIPAEQFLNTVSKELVAAVHAGKADPKIIDKFNKLVANSLGITSDNLATKISGSNVVDTIMTATATWWGKGQFLNPARGTFDAGIRNAQARAEKLRRLSQKYTKDEIASAWKVVTGNGGQVGDPRVMEMASFFRDYMDSVLKVPAYGMQLENAAIKHLSTAERSQMMMRDVNRHLKEMNGVKAFQFTDAKVGEMARDAWGIKRDFSATGEGWQASWARWNPDDPLKTLYDIDLAMERATREYAFLDNFVFNFGKLVPEGAHNFKVPLDRISDFYVPKEVGLQMMRVMNDVHKGAWIPNSPLGRFHGKALRVWKTGVTIYLPSHHIRNGIGDTYLMWLAGHNDPRAFIWGKRIMHSQKGRYNQVMKSGTFDELSQFTDPNAAKWAATNGKDVILNTKGTRVTAEELYVNAWNRGLLKDANQLEDIFGESRIGFKPLAGKAHDLASSAAEYREHFIRLSHFTAAVNKSLKRGRKDLESIFDDAAAEVRKWHPDGTDLTRFEQKYMRNIIPFYSWLRKSTPLLVESLVTRPAKALAYPRGMVALQNMMGIDATVSDPFPDDQLFPEWIRGYGIGPIGDAESSNPFSAWWGNLGKNMIDINGNPYGYTVVNPSNPLIDAGNQYLGFDLTDTGRGIIDSLTPFLKVPYELGTDSQFTGAPIYKDSGGQGLLHYLSKQLPMTAPIQRITDMGDRERVGKEPGMDIESLINTLTALGLHGTAPYIKTAEFEKKDKLRNQ